MFPSLTMCTQLCNLRTGIIVMQLKVQAGNRNGDHQLCGLWDGRRTFLIAGLQSAKQRPNRNLQLDIPLNSRSTNVIPHDSHWSHHSGSGMYCMHVNDLCGESGAFVIRYHHWDKPCRNIPVKTLCPPRITTDIRTEEKARFQAFPH